MAIRKVCGIETEYGISVRGADSNPVAASSVLINAYIATLDRRTVWDFEDESPGIDARGFAVEGALPPEVETHLVNTVLTNGSRYYVDHAHPEVSTPECVDAMEVVVFDRASEEVLKRSMVAARSLLPDGAEIIVYKNNSDGKGNSYGCHENYLLARELPFGRLVSQITPHFVTRQVFCGAGKVGSESPGVPSAEVPFQLSQRADFFEEEVGLETTLKRPIVNTRDEPHCDGQRYRRFHVIVGDANRSEVATFLKVGTTAIVLSMIEDDQMPIDLALSNPVGAIRQVSHDPSLTRTVLLKNGRRLTALDVQWQLLEQARKYERERGWRAWGRRWAPRSSAAGRRSWPVSSGTGRPWPRSSTGWRRSGCTRGTASATVWSGATPGCGRWTSSTTTCATIVHSSTAWVWSGSATTPRSARGHRAADDHAGLLPGQVPPAVAQRHRGRQLGLDGLRRRAGPAAPGADDGTATRNSRACG